jgi:hypothetical protein
MQNSHLSIMRDDVMATLSSSKVDQGQLAVQVIATSVLDNDLTDGVRSTGSII